MLSIVFILLSNPKITEMRNRLKCSISDDHCHFIDIVLEELPNESNGFIIELGGLDGTYKNTLSEPFEEIGWTRMLIDGNPIHEDKRKSLYPNTTSIFSAICNKTKTVHYVQKNGGVDGIIEFMNNAQLNRWHPNIFKMLIKNSFDYKSLKEKSTFSIPTPQYH